MKKRNKKPKKTIKIPVLTWTSSNGRTVPITKLEDSHLINILRFLHRRKRWRDMHSVLLADCTYGNLMKELNALNAMDRFIGDEQPLYKVLKSELQRRAEKQVIEDINNSPF